MSLLETAQANVKKYNIDANGKIKASYISLVNFLEESILKTSKRGGTFVRYSFEGRVGKTLTIWNSIPLLLKDPKFEGFEITPKNPDEDDVEITIKWK